MQYAQIVIVEFGGKEVEIVLQSVITIGEIYDIFWKLTGLRCMITLSAGVARVNCDIPQTRKTDEPNPSGR